MIVSTLVGMQGEALPCPLQSNPIIITMLFMCIVLTAFSFSKKKKYLVQQLKSVITHKERSSIFNETTNTDGHYSILLGLQTCILLAFSTLYHYVGNRPLPVEQTTHLWLLGGLFIGVCTFILLKCLLYQLVDWVFFQKVKHSVWIASFFHSFIWLGILLLPVMLVILYFDLSTQASVFLIGLLIIFAKIALFWKCFSNFFEKIHGALHLILYFCALEILPDLVLWKGIELMSNNLILNL